MVITSFPSTSEDGKSKAGAMSPLDRQTLEREELALLTPLE
jgi:hypothetical protein